MSAIGAPRLLGEAVALGEQVAALVDHGLAVPGQVGRRLPLAGGRVEVRRGAARAGAAYQLAAVLGAGDGDRAAGQVEQHVRTGERGLRARWDRHPHVLADLHVDLEVGQVAGREDQVGPERHRLAREVDEAAAAVVARGEPPALVELPVRRQVGLRRDPQHPPAMDHDRAVEHPGAVLERRPDHDHRQQVGAGGDDLLDPGHHRLEQGVLEEQVVDGVAGQRELGEHRHRDAFVVAQPRLLDHPLRVGSRVGDRDRQRAGGNPREPVGVGGVEVHGVSLGIRSPDQTLGEGDVGRRC